MRRERRTSRVLSKYTAKGLQPLNGKMMFLDFPVRRPTYYYVELENGDSLEVSAYAYQKYYIGATISYDHEIWETQDYILLGLVLLIVIAVIVAIAIA